VTNSLGNWNECIWEYDGNGNKLTKQNLWECDWEWSYGEMGSGRFIPTHL